MAVGMAETDTMMFGRFKILSSQIFHKTKHSFALVNLRPIVPGHVLVVSNRVAPLISDLNDDEYDDLWKSVRKVQRVLKQKFNCKALITVIACDMKLCILFNSLLPFSFKPST